MIWKKSVEIYKKILLFFYAYGIMMLKYKKRKEVNTMKRVLYLAMALVMCLGLAACGSQNNDPAATNTPSASNNKTYVIYSDNSFAPFEFMDEASGEYIGVDMDILAAVAADQGFSYSVKNEGFKAAMGAVQSGQADGMIAGMTINDERKATFDFSDGYFEDGQVLTVAKDSDIKTEEDLKGKTIAAKNGTMGLQYAESIKDKYGFTISYYEDSPSMYQAIINGVNDACFEDFSVIGWAIQSENVALKTVGDVINPAQYGFAVKKGENAELLELFNKGLENIKANGKYDEILNKYGYGDK